MEHDLLVRIARQFLNIHEADLNYQEINIVKILVVHEYLEVDGFGAFVEGKKSKE